MYFPLPPVYQSILPMTNLLVIPQIPQTLPPWVVAIWIKKTKPLTFPLSLLPSLVLHVFIEFVFFKLKQA